MADKKIYYDEKGFPIYDSKDFPDHSDFLAKSLNEMEKDTAERKKTAPAAKSDFYNKIGRYVPGAMSTIGGAAGEAVMPAGGGIAGALLGSVLANRMKASRPEDFGSNSESNLGQFVDVAKDTASSALPGALAKSLLTKGVMGTVGSALPTSILGHFKQFQMVKALLSALTPATQPLSKGGQIAVDAARTAGPLAVTPPPQQ
jgi:hypothetical protein